MHDPDSFELKVTEFPKEFHRKLTHVIDKRYYGVLASSILFHVLLITYFLLNPLSTEKAQDRISKIQERLARTIKENEAKLDERLAKFDFVKGQRVEQKEDLTKPDQVKQPSTSKRARKEPSPKKESQIASRGRKPGGGRRSNTKADIEATVGSKGILGLLTSSGSTARGEEVEDILGRSSDSQTDLDEALANLTGIKAGGRPGSRGEGVGNGDATVRGGRNQGAEGIDALVSGLGKTKSSSFTRTGELVVVSESPLIERSSATGIVGRNQDDVQVVVTRHNNSIEYCYERELKRDPNLKGKIVIRFTITPQGTVKNVELISSTLNNRKVERCVISRVRRWSDFGAINPSYGDTTIRQVYAFGY